MGDGGVCGNEREQVCTPGIFKVVRLPDGAEEHSGDAWRGVTRCHVPKVSITTFTEKEKDGEINSHKKTCLTFTMMNMVLPSLLKTKYLCLPLCLEYRSCNKTVTLTNRLGNSVAT